MLSRLYTSLGSRTNFPSIHPLEVRAADLSVRVRGNIFTLQYLYTKRLFKTYDNTGKD